MMKRMLRSHRVQKRGRSQQEPGGHCAEPDPSEMLCLHLSPPRQLVRRLLSGYVPKVEVSVAQS